MKKFLATLLALTMLIGMVGMIPASAEEVVTLKWVTVGSGMPSNYAAWAGKLNAYLAEKIGVNIEMEVICLGRLGQSPQCHRQHQRALRSDLRQQRHLQQRREAGRVSGDHRGHAEGKCPRSAGP